MSPFDTDNATPKLFFLNSEYRTTRATFNLRKSLTSGVTIAVVAMLESLMCLEVMNDLTRTAGEPNRQLWALGLGNLLAGLFGTMGGNSLIELCVMNVQAGGRHRVSSTVCAAAVLVIFTVGYDLLNYIPVGALAGVMVTVVLDTVRWTSIPAILAALVPNSWLEPGRVGASGEPVRRTGLQEHLRSVRIGGYDAFIVVTVTVLTAVTNLAVAVGAGVCLSALRFAYQSQRPLDINAYVRDGVKTYELSGPVFFGSRRRIIEAFDPAKDPAVVEINFAGAEIFDFSIIEEFRPILEQYADLSTVVRILNLADATHLPALLRFRTVEDGGRPAHVSVLSVATADRLCDLSRGTTPAA